jgi:hypothetical protein
VSVGFNAAQAAEQSGIGRTSLPVEGRGVRMTQISFDPQSLGQSGFNPN